jgi:hypothetical protein
MILEIFLLDGAQGLVTIPFYFFLHVATTVLIEGSVLYLFKYNKFGRSCRDVFLVNGASLVIGLLLLSTFDDITELMTLRFDPLLFTLGLYYIQTIIVEGIGLWLLDKTFPIKRLIPAVLIMNVITYFTLYLILKYAEI